MDEQTDATDAGRLTRFFASRRNRILLGVGLVCVVVRIALPEILRPILVTRADEALEGRIELEDLDLALLRGGVTLHGFSVHSDERPSDAPALFEAERLSTNISWLALLGRTLEIEELAIESFAVRLDRMADGLRLPKPIPTEEADASAPADSEEEPPILQSWSFAANLIALRDGRVDFVDHTVKGEPERFQLGIEDFSARELAIRAHQTDEEPGRIAIEAQLDQGSVSLSAWIKQYEAGIDVRSTLNLVDIPIDKLRAYLTTFGWDELGGNLDASLEHHYEPGGVHEVRGKLSLAELRVGVPRFDEPALAWEDLEVVLDRVDLVKRHAAIESIRSTGARVLVDPKSDSPLTVLTPPVDNAADEDPPKAASEPKAEPAPTADRPATVAETEVAEPATAQPGWTWRVEKTSVADLVVDLRGAEAPLLLRAQAELASLSSEPDVRTPLTLAITTEQGRLELSGELAPSPFAFDGKLRITDLALPPLAAQVEAPALAWLRQGTLRADLALSIGDDLRASGRVGLAGLDLGEAQTAKQFAVEWKDLDVAIERIELKNLAGRSAAGEPRSLGVKLSRVQLSEPRFVLTHDADGLVIPPLAAAEGGAGEPVEAPPAEIVETPTPLAVHVAIADARIEGASGRLADRAVEPYYRGQIEALEVHATGVRWPENEVDALDLKMQGLRGATLTVKGAVHPGKSTLEGKLEALPLDQFNPYLASTGYRLRQGALSLDSTARFLPEHFDTESKLVLAALDVGGGGDGEAAFQETFGVPLSVALGLLKDLDGKIKLAIPLAGERDKVKVGLGRIVTQALRKALVGALASPLKLFGVVTGGGKIESLAPRPIAFAPGSSELTSEGADRAEELAGLLAASPGIALVLTGQGSESDQRVLRERALLTQLEASRGVRALAALGEITTRRAVRDHLGQKLAGETPRPLTKAESDWLDHAISQSERPTRALEELAEARAARLRELLASEHGIAATRLVVESPRVDPPAAEPGVGVALAALGASKSPAP